MDMDSNVAWRPMGFTASQFHGRMQAIREIQLKEKEAFQRVLQKLGPAASKLQDIYDCKHIDNGSGGGSQYSQYDPRIIEQMIVKEVENKLPESLHTPYATQRAHRVQQFLSILSTKKEQTALRLHQEKAHIRRIKAAIVTRMTKLRCEAKFMQKQPLALN